MDVRTVRLCGKFPNAPVAPLRAGRQCKLLRLQEIESSRQFAANVALRSLFDSNKHAFFRASDFKSGHKPLLLSPWNRG